LERLSGRQARHSPRAFDVRDQLSKVNVPTLLITPAHDKLIGEKAARELREGLPNAREEILPATGHMFRFTHPDLYGKTILDFLADVDLAAHRV
jgi:pimeloyl-ACP methyl ester carboxylesterase